MIQLEDFKVEFLDDHPTPYYKWTDGEVQICLESCTNGLCVGIYDGEDWILAEKKCTNMPGGTKINVDAGEYEWKATTLRLNILWIFPLYLTETERPTSNVFTVLEC